MSEDKRFAAISRWLRENGYKLRCLNTARGNKTKPLLILVDKNTNIEVARA